MAYETGALDATLAAAAGDDPQLFAELRREQDCERIDQLLAPSP